MQCTDRQYADRQYANLQYADKTSVLQAWFQTLLSHAPVLNLFYTNGYAELAWAQIIALYAGPPADTETYYQRVFEAGGVLSLYEACR